MFNPDPIVERVPILPGNDCLVIDHALGDPERWVALAAEHRTSFRSSSHNAFPGVELRLPEALSSSLDEYFARHLRRNFGARRTLRMYSRLSMVTTPPQALSPRQWICHRDRMEIEPGRCVVACVLYLFRAPELGGTSFYRPRAGAIETARLVHDSGVMAGPEFRARYRISQGYMTDSNEWFERLSTIEARFNRLIFYDGMLFHGADIRRPDLLSADPRHGRLSLNGFFTCRSAVPRNIDAAQRET